jgi:hypothetical protein
VGASWRTSFSGNIRTQEIVMIQGFSAMQGKELGESSDPDGDGDAIPSESADSDHEAESSIQPADVMADAL